MKTKIATLTFFITVNMVIAQVKTKVVTIDLSEPKTSSIQVKSDDKTKSKWLSAKSKEMISIQLINGNPIKYDYKINNKTVSLFMDEKNINDFIEQMKTKKATETDNKYNKTKDELKKDNETLFNNVTQLEKKSNELYDKMFQENSIDHKKVKTTIDSILPLIKIYIQGSHENLECLENIKKTDKDTETLEKEIHKTDEKANELLKSFTQKFLNTNFDNYTLPIDLQGKNIDALEFTVKRFNKANKQEDPDFTAIYNVWIKGGLKIDISAGAFITSLSDNIFDKKDDDKNNGQKIIEQKNKGHFDFAFGSTINTYVRMNSWVVPTINFGVIFTSNQKFQMILGGGVILGKQERIILNAGLSMGIVQRLADGYNVGDSYNLGNTGAIPTQNEFAFGHFFGISYNLSKVNKMSFK